MAVRASTSLPGLDISVYKGAASHEVGWVSTECTVFLSSSFIATCSCLMAGGVVGVTVCGPGMASRAAHAG